MTPTTAALALLLVFGVALTPGRVAASDSDLANSYWEGDNDCFIADIAFYADGTVDIDYDNGDDDTGTWMLSGTSLTIEFDGFDEKFLGNFSLDTIKAAHIWNEDASTAPKTETCTFHRAEVPQQNAAPRTPV